MTTHNHITETEAFHLIETAVEHHGTRSYIATMLAIAAQLDGATINPARLTARAMTAYKATSSGKVTATAKNAEGRITRIFNLASKGHATAARDVYSRIRNGVDAFNRDREKGTAKARVDHENWVMQAVGLVEANPQPKKADISKLVRDAKTPKAAAARKITSKAALDKAFDSLAAALLAGGATFDAEALRAARATVVLASPERGDKPLGTLDALTSATADDEPAATGARDDYDADDDAPETMFGLPAETWDALPERARTEVRTHWLRRHSAD